MRSTTLTAQAIDDVLAGSFPASDPPAWTPGIVRPAPEIGEAADTRNEQDETNDVRASDVIDVSRPTHSKRTFAQALVAHVGAAGLALLLPLAILAVGTPVALGVRGRARSGRLVRSDYRLTPWWMRTRRALTP